MSADHCDGCPYLGCPSCKYPGIADCQLCHQPTTDGAICADCGDGTTLPFGAPDAPGTTQTRPYGHRM